ncbi:MAG TPA: endonuclease III [Terriglobia bacterium]|nr:endonuclease III [Terriglobia bacterium]
MTKEEQDRIRKILSLLKAEYPDAQCALTHADPLQLLIATILSAQCTDVRVNQVTPVLFQRYPTISDLAEAKLSELEDLIRSTGFFRNKARNIKAACQQLVNKFSGKIPHSMEELLTLQGVARKTANVVLGSAFGIPSGIVVDTHVFRLSHRLRLTHAKTPEKVEQDLMRKVPREEWINFSHRLIFHGRRVCTARKPLCHICSLDEVCPKVGVKKVRR